MQYKFLDSFVVVGLGIVMLIVGASAVTHVESQHHASNAPTYSVTVGEVTAQSPQNFDASR